MVDLYNDETNQLIGSITEADLKVLQDALEEESSEDQDYYIDRGNAGRDRRWPCDGTSVPSRSSLQLSQLCQVLVAQSIFVQIVGQRSGADTHQPRGLSFES
jgi:hypothetical protein